MKVLIPMAGAGSRFINEGYTFPKPLIDVQGKPMIQKVVENLDFDCEYVFLVRKKHVEQYSGLVDTLDRITNGKFQYVEVDGLTEGAACTALLAEKYIDKIKNAGAIFIGLNTPEALGDYVAGPNHVLPTNGTAKFSSGLSVLDFYKRTTVVKCNKKNLAIIGKHAVTLAKAEGLDAHAMSISLRIDK